VVSGQRLTSSQRDLLRELSSVDGTGRRLLCDGGSWCIEGLSGRWWQDRTVQPLLERGLIEKRQIRVQRA
jgi:hypothetical protein